MILIRKNQTNKITVTLSELASASLPNYWLFVFKLEQDEDTYQYRIQLADTSTNTERYNQFTLIEGTDLTFRFNDYYKYECYQMPNATSIDENDGILVEKGKMRVVETETPTPTFEANSETPIYEQ